MTHGSREINNFDENLTCEGIIGDGCGGGRLFTIDENKLKAYDPQSQESITLLENIHKPISISKKGCIVFITCEDENIEFDLSNMRKINNNM
ncbi:thiamine biosynthesis protein ThiF [Candidatus Sulfurimonas marisnigri]|uniref:Thiamine biosynthesis protein ThiF n=1 Tax=Candidatus Sulfurimonas marisnigri TaxID=2740405 RepID=A0A7S7LZ78_9BACT|nr:thiamine biosynthesis protein ThiF [Candidatus Sulfurimonas marisnigri]QOY54156.1 thiamine biosynthesis protein ThiF [Candidatus Sulfurimonas marisnigri]